jgi:hypothetical protein
MGKLMPNPRLILGLALACAAAPFAPRPAGAAPAATPTIVAADPTRTSAVAFSDASVTVAKVEYEFHHIVCIAFVNHGPRTATKVGFSLANVDTNGTVLSVDTLYPTGKFPVDKRSAFSGGSRFTAISPNGNCHDTFAYHTPVRSALDYKSGRDAEVPVAAVLVSVREIVYDDGTAWRTDNVPKNGDRLPVPSLPPFAAAVPAGLPVISAANVEGSPFETLDAYALELTRQPLGPPFGLRRYACAIFANRDARMVKRIGLAIELVDRNGVIAMTNADDETAYLPRNAKPTDPIDVCPELYGKYEADTFLYEWPGHSLPLGRVVVIPVSAEFTDGSKWRTPWFPKIGDPATPPS